MSSRQSLDADAPSGTSLQCGRVFTTFGWPDPVRATMRLALHEHSLQVVPVAAGIPWLGFVVYPTHRRVKARKVRHATGRLEHLYGQWQGGEISFGTFDAAVQGWVNHVRFADSWGLRWHVLERFDLNGAVGVKDAGVAQRTGRGG